MHCFHRKGSKIFLYIQYYLIRSFFWKKYSRRCNVFISLLKIMQKYYEKLENILLKNAQVKICILSMLNSLGQWQQCVVNMCPKKVCFSINEYFVFICSYFLARATVMNYFRIPLNLIVVVILLRVKLKYKYVLHK